ncbi:MAG: diaminopimelate decarboxylase [Chloroflexota bacterium]
MPISDDYRQRLYPHLSKITETFGTPFHIYDEIGIRQTTKRIFNIFSDFNFKEYYAVKALPNPHILTILREEGCGFDCSSIPELILAHAIGASGDDIMFTSNNTSRHEFELALAKGSAIINLDDVHFLDVLSTLPDLISFRVNFGTDMGNTIIGKPTEAKFGIPQERIVKAYRQAKQRGIIRFGLHTMVVSNECDYQVHLQSVERLCQIAIQLKSELGITLEFINIGGGLGIPYHPDETPLDLDAFGSGIHQLWQKHNLQDVALKMESGRYVTAPHGVLVTKIINRKESYRTCLGVDANMSALMRPAMYGAYHHIDVVSRSVSALTEVVDVVGALCENNDKFAIQRELPKSTVGDLIIIHDTGAHGHAMGFNYNGRLRPQELLLRADGTVERIRRAETLEDYFATLKFDALTLSTDAK